MSDELPTIEFVTESGERRRVSYERDGARVVRRVCRHLDGDWVPIGGEALRSLSIGGEARMPVTVQTKRADD